MRTDAELRGVILGHTARASNGCWVWQGVRDSCGYGRLRHGWRRERVHRAAYRVFIGTIPPGLHVLHRCDNPPCANPEHLWIGTHDDNMADMAEKGRGRGRGLAGEKNASAKLFLDDVKTIRVLSACGEMQREIAARFGVCQMTISHIVTGKTWREGGKP